jgi:pimeloyl-ACP methyl ester carboxylesterase
MTDSFPKPTSRWWSTTATTTGSDGTALFFSYGGNPNGLPLVCSNGVGVSTFFWDHIGTHFCPKHQVLVWDYPGHGASDAPQQPEALSIRSLSDDLLRVLDAANIDRAVLLGHSMGCQVIFEFCHRHPDRVLGLVPMLGAPGHPVDTFLHPSLGKPLFKLGYGLGTRIPGIISKATRLALRERVAWHSARLLGFVHADLCPRESMVPYLEHLAQLDLRVFFELVRSAQEHDATPFLHTLDVPALVIAGEKDLFTPRELSLEMVRRLARAEFLEIHGGSHAALIEQPQLINLRLEKFLAESVAPFARGETTRNRARA